MSNRGKKAENENIHDIVEQEVSEINPIDPDAAIFALDIGTRNVVGIVGIEKDDIFNIIDIEVMEHRSRAMMDGQIHDIAKVAEVVRIVKERLESRVGFAFTSVAIAAAGRVLKTYSVRVDRKLEHGTAITQNDVRSLELEGIQIAQEKIHEEDSNSDMPYYCVGHSVINYYLNGYVISNLAGHKGKNMSAIVLATFLPQTVIDSLNAVVEKVGLRVASLTLEPIAAANVSISHDIRLLNIAMVDVGAGTSDIAVTRDGTIVAYGMCPVAGDEISEKIAQHYLLDFNTAERVKKELIASDIVEFEDIMGLKQKVKSAETIEVIEPVVKHLAEVVAEIIISCNGKAPNAVICIGGGSQTPGFVKLLAEVLELPEERVGIRGKEIITNVKSINKHAAGPEIITPIGIAVTALMQRGHDFIQIRVNERSIRLFNAEKVTVGDAVSLYGFTAEQLIPKSGDSITFELNGKKHTVRGSYGKPAEIFVNEIPSNLDTQIKSGDIIKITASENGQPAKVFVEDFIKDLRVKKILFNGNQLDVTTKAMLNGNPVSTKASVNNGDKLHIEEIRTIKELAAFSEINLGEFDIFANDIKESRHYVIQSDDVIKAVIKPEGERIIEDEQNEELEDSGEKEMQYSHNHTKNIIVSVNGEDIELKGKSNYIFVDVFNHYNFDMSNPKGSVTVKLNGSKASFTDTIRDGDKIEIFWEKN